MTDKKTDMDFLFPEGGGMSIEDIRAAFLKETQQKAERKAEELAIEEEMIAKASAEFVEAPTVDELVAHEEKTINEEVEVEEIADEFAETPTADELVAHEEKAIGDEVEVEEPTDELAETPTVDELVAHEEKRINEEPKLETEMTPEERAGFVEAPMADNVIKHKKSGTPPITVTARKRSTKSIVSGIVFALFSLFIIFSATLAIMMNAPARGVGKYKVFNASNAGTTGSIADNTVIVVKETKLADLKRSDNIVFISAEGDAPLNSYFKVSNVKEVHYENGEANEASGVVVSFADSENKETTLLYQNVQGVVKVKIPFFGKYILFIQNNAGVLLAVLSVVALAMLVYMIVSSRKNKEKAGMITKKSEKKSNKESHS